VISWNLFRHFCLILTFWGPPKKEKMAAMRKLDMSRVHNYLKCHRNVSKQANPLQVDNLITNKYVGILEASKRTLSTQCVNISVLAHVKKCLKTL